MPSQLHEALLLLFRNRPALAPKLLRDALQLTLPPFSEARLHSADLTEMQPTEYRADLVVLLSSAAVPGTAALGIVVEVQLSVDQHKRFAWPAYVATLRARLKCPVCLLVVTADERVARWAAEPVDLGGGNTFTPLVLRPSGVPVVTDEKQARINPELAVLSAIAHGHDKDIDTSVRIAMVARKAAAALDEDRSRLYYDVARQFLNEAARAAFLNMTEYTREFLKTYKFTSPLARHFIAQGKAEGIAKGKAEGRAQGFTDGEQRGRAALVSKQLAVRFGRLKPGVRRQIDAASIAELDVIAERLLTAGSLKQALKGD